MSAGNWINSNNVYPSEREKLRTKVKIDLYEILIKRKYVYLNI